MPLLTARLDRVFDIVRQGGRGPETWFSVECDGRCHYGLRAPLYPELRDRMIVTAYLEREDDWSSLLGWLDHANGKIVYRDLSQDASPLIFAAAALFAWQWLWPTWPLVSLLLGPLSCAMLWAGWRQLAQRRDILRQFKSVREKLGSARLP